MSSSDDDPIPLSKRSKIATNGHKKSAATVSAAIDRKLDREMMDIDEDHAPGIATTSSINKAMNGSTGKRRASTKAPIIDDSSDSDVPLTKKRKLANGTSKSKPKDESDDDDDIPLIRSRPAKANGKRTITTKKAQETEDEDYDSDDVPLHKKLAAEKVSIMKKAETTAKKARASKVKKEESEESDSDVPIAKKRKAVTPAKKVATKAVKKEDKATSAKKTMPAKTTPVKGKGKAVKKEETSPGKEEEEAVEGEDDYKWWEAQQTDGKEKFTWKTLEHSGVLFAPPYEPLPKSVKMKYDGVPLTLSDEAEEVAGFMAALMQADQAKDKKFTDNFFQDWCKVLKENGGAKDKNGKPIKIESYDKCDFMPMWEHFDAIKTAKKAIPLKERKEVKAIKDREEEHFTFCMLDGRKEKVGNFRIEPPGLFRGRGDHPKRGKLKLRIHPEQVTINISKGVPVPVPPKGHKWAKVQHDNSVGWLATWTENINKNTKYVMLAATSSLKGMSDMKKYEKARELKNCIDKIRDGYASDLKAKEMVLRQRGTAIYLIDVFALRAGNEKGDDEADTVGCCSLRYEHVTLNPPNELVFDFLGKDSIRFLNSVNVIPQVFKNIKLFKKDKGPGDDLFDRITPAVINKWYGQFMEGLTAKVFRTYNASWTMQHELKKLKNVGTIIEKIAAYNDANRKVAVLCNHQRAVAKTHEGQLEKMDNEIRGLMYTKWRLKKMILDLDPKQMKKRPQYFARDEEIDDDDWIKTHQEWLIEQEKLKIEKKFEKENEKLAAEGEKEMKTSELNERLLVCKEMKKEFDKENKTGKVPAQGKAPTVEKFEQQIEKLDEKIFTKLNLKKDKDNNKAVSLGTSKTNYIDPRLTVAFCKRFDVPIEKVFPKTLREKFKWAIDSAGPDWEF